MKAINTLDPFLLYPETIDYNRVNRDVSFKIGDFLEKHGDERIDGVSLWHLLVQGEIEFNSFFHFSSIVKDFMFLLKDIGQIKTGKRAFYLDHVAFNKSSQEKLSPIQTKLIHKHFPNAIKKSPMITTIPFTVEENKLPAFIEITDEIASCILSRVLKYTGKGVIIPTMYRRIIIFTQYNQYQNELPWQLDT